MNNIIKELDYAKAVSSKTHPVPINDTRFYRRFKPELPLSNSTTTYNKHRERLLELNYFTGSSE